MSRLLEEVSREHFPHPPASPEELEEFERRVGWPLDPDLRAFYLHCNGAELFKPFSEFLENALRSKGRQFWLKRAAGR